MTKRVPAELHHELAEYASLLRALRVRDTMDVTKHITQRNPFVLDDTELNSADDLDDDELGNDEGNLSPRSSLPPSTLAVSQSRSHSPPAAPKQAKSAKAKGKEKEKESTKPPARAHWAREHWTRWPLLLQDVHAPEWGLEDEVAVIVAQVMKGRAPPSFPVPVADSALTADEEPMYAPPVSLEYDEEDPDPPLYVPYITAVVANLLSTVLTALACLVPPRTAGFQNRIEPLGWRTVVDALVAIAPSEFVNPKIVEHVIHRMEAIYGPSIIPLEGDKSTSLRAVERLHLKKAATERLNARIDGGDLPTYWVGRPLVPSQASPNTKRRAQEEQERSMETAKRARKSATPPEDFVDPGGPSGSQPSSSRGTAKRTVKRVRKATTPPEEEFVDPGGPSGSQAARPVADSQTRQDGDTSATAEEAGTSTRRSTRKRKTLTFNFPGPEAFFD